MQENFEETSVEIVECPDFSLDGFGFTGKGLGSDLRIAEIGGQGNLFPIIRREKVFNLKRIAEVCELPECFIFGPGAGPRNFVGINAEMVADACFFGQSNSKVNTHTSKIVKNTYKQEEISDPGCGPLANLGLCKNESAGPVLKITAKRRTGQLNFPETIRQVIAQHYGAKLVSMAGIFLVEKGKVMIHVMPDFPENDFYSRDELQNEWLQYFEVNAPLVCASVLHSTDPDLDLRLEHTHLFSKHGDAGHYHYDTTPDTVEYTGYFKAAEKLYRIDQVDIHGREIDLV